MKQLRRGNTTCLPGRLDRYRLDLSGRVVRKYDNWRTEGGVSGWKRSMRMEMPKDVVYAALVYAALAFKSLSMRLLNHSIAG